MLYKYGASDPDYRKLPILHLCIYEAIKIGLEKGITLLDLGGYNHFINKKDQIYSINFFKKSFNGTYSFYPKKIHIKLNPYKYYLIKILKPIYKKLFN